MSYKGLMAIDPGSKEMGVMFTGCSAPFTLRVSAHKRPGRELREWRFADLSQQLENLFKYEARDVDCVIYERPFCRGMDATRCLWGIAGIIEALATLSGCAVLDVGPGTITSWALGTGKAPKKRDKNPMIELASTMGYGTLNEHEADALMLYHYGLQHIETGEPK